MTSVKKTIYEERSYDRVHFGTDMLLKGTDGYWLMQNTKRRLICAKNKLEQRKKMMMRKNKKLYWLSFALQFTLAILAFLKIDNLAYANFVAIWLALIWILRWLFCFFKNNKTICY
ncbi:MAG: hypothetical protein ACI4PK_00930 [Oscillospiraceae bacterium]